MKRFQYCSFLLISWLVSSINGFVRPCTSHTRRTSLNESVLRKNKDKKDLVEQEDDDFLMAGGTKPKALVHERDYFRQDTRLQAWDNYVLVSVLCTSISYNALQGFQVSPEHRGVFLYDELMGTAIHLLAGLAVLSGLYSTMVFSLSILYGKSALGMERDPQFDTFMEKSAQIRIQGFRAFSLNLVLFGSLVVLVITEYLPLVGGFPVGLLLFGALFYGYRDWQKLVDSAGGIFSDD
jgi:hypothetical protein